MYKKSLAILLFTFVNILFSQTRTVFQNVVITNYHSPNEPSIIVNKNNTQNIIVAENSNSYYVSNDGGSTWTRRTINSNSGYCCDPSLNSDNQGNIYFFHLSHGGTSATWIDRIVCQKSTDEGLNFTQDTFTGYNPPKKQDKQWAVIDPVSHNIYVTWTQFDAYGSTSAADFSNIHFSKSTDGGLTWSAPIQINDLSGNCVDSDATVEGAVPAVGTNGEIYVSWVGPAGLVFDKSTDGGQTWLPNDIVINDMLGSGGWDYDIPGIDRCNGLPITKCDLSNSPYRGTIYVNWSDQRNGTDNTDIFLSKSTDGGTTWSAPIKVNDDSGHKHQFLTWMDIDQTTGYLYFVFYDRRNYNDNNTDVYMAVSTDGGQSFTNTRISDSPFIPDSSHFFGDYTNISAYNGVIRPVWTRLHISQQSLLTALISQNDLVSTKEIESPVVQASIYPVPVDKTLSIKYKLKTNSEVTINLIDNTGRLIDVLLENTFRSKGKNREVFDVKNLDLNKGIYFVQIQSEGLTRTIKFIKR